MRAAAEGPGRPGLLYSQGGVQPGPHPLRRGPPVHGIGGRLQSKFGVFFVNVGLELWLSL